MTPFMMIAAGYVTGGAATLGSLFANTIPRLAEAVPQRNLQRDVG